MLKKNVTSNNRHISPTTVAGYVDEMKNGRWRLTGDAIMFNEKGELINGQHRMTAVIQSGVPCKFVVMDNIDDDTRAVIDLGRARSVPDMLKMVYGIERASMVTGAVRILDDFLDDRRFKASAGHVLEAMEMYGDGFKWATGSMPGKSIFSNSTIIAGLVYAHRTAPEAVETFARQMCDGANLSGESAILLLRKHIFSLGGAGNRRDEKRETFLLVLTAALFIEARVRHLRAVWIKAGSKQDSKLHRQLLKAERDGLLIEEYMTEVQSMEIMEAVHGATEKWERDGFQPETESRRGE